MKTFADFQKELKSLRSEYQQLVEELCSDVQLDLDGVLADQIDTSFDYIQAFEKDIAEIVENLLKRA